MVAEFKTRKPSDWWNTLVIGVLAAIAFLVFWFNGCSPAPQSVANSTKAEANTSTAPAPPASASLVNTTGESVPTSLANAGEYGENIYDYAQANDWKNADVKLRLLKETSKKVRADVKSQGAAVERLEASVATLNNAVSAKDRQATMREANQVTLNAANMSAAYKLSVPVEVTRLDYYGRELEVWAQAKDTNKLQANAREIRREWEKLRPSVELHNKAEAKKFDALVGQVEGAKTPVDYARVAKPVLDEVDNLEKVFQG